MPNILSPASPALFWAWLRYYLAPATSTDLRVTRDFSDLDPHQKGILSDDFGVAVATHWLSERLGPFTHIVDGRRFANQFSHLLRLEHKSKAKVGMSKAPDFVMRDVSGKWHILECKGTQSNRDYQKNVLKTAVIQKNSLQLLGSIRGEQLASSLYISTDGEIYGSHLKIVDPEPDDPILTLSGRNAKEMIAHANRLVIAQALGSIGLNEIATEISLPSGADLDNTLLLPSEKARLRTPGFEREARTSEQVRGSTLDQFQHERRHYRGRVVELALPPIASSMPYRRVRIRHGVVDEIIQTVLSDGTLRPDQFEQSLASYAGQGQIRTQAEEESMAIKYGGLYSELTWF